MQLLVVVGGVDGGVADLQGGLPGGCVVSSQGVDLVFSIQDTDCRARTVWAGHVHCRKKNNKRLICIVMAYTFSFCKRDLPNRM